MAVNDDNAIITAVKKTLLENADAAGSFAAGKEKVFGFLMGQAMKNLSGKGDPASVKKILLKALKETYV